MNVNEFLTRFDRIKDTEFLEIVGYGSANPVNSREKFINMRRNGVNVVQWLKPIIQTYILSSGSQAFTKHPNDIVKFIDFQLAKRRQAIKKLIKIVKELGAEKEITDMYICKSACRLTFCEREYKQRCDKNICDECKKMKM